MALVVLFWEGGRKEGSEGMCQAGVEEERTKECGHGLQASRKECRDTSG